MSCSPRGSKELDTTEQLNSTQFKFFLHPSLESHNAYKFIKDSEKSCSKENYLHYLTSNISYIFFSITSIDILGDECSVEYTGGCRARSFLKSFCTSVI